MSLTFIQALITRRSASTINIFWPITSHVDWIIEETGLTFAVVCCSSFTLPKPFTTVGIRIIAVVLVRTIHFMTTVRLGCWVFTIVITLVTFWSRSTLGQKIIITAVIHQVEHHWSSITSIFAKVMDSMVGHSALPVPPAIEKIWKDAGTGAVDFLISWSTIQKLFCCGLRAAMSRIIAWARPTINF